MTLKGDYSGATSYSVGDVVRFDGMAFVLSEPAAAGTPPKVDRCWTRLDQTMWSVVDLILDSVDIVDAKIPKNISDEAIVLKGTTDPTSEFLVSVDDSGLTPDLAVELIEPEEEAET